VLQFPCPSIDTPRSNVDSAKSSCCVTKKSKRQHEALLSEACYDTGPQRLRFLFSDLVPARACLRKGSEEWSKRRFQTGGPFRQKGLFCNTSLKMIFSRPYSLRSQNHTRESPSKAWLGCHGCAEPGSGGFLHAGPAGSGS